MATQVPDNVIWVRRVQGKWLSAMALNQELRVVGAEVRAHYGSHRALAIELDPETSLQAVTEILTRLGWAINEGYVPQSRPCEFCHGNGYRYDSHYTTSEHNPRVNELLGSGQRVMYYKKVKETCQTCRGTGHLFG